MHFESIMHFLAMLKELFPEPTKNQMEWYKIVFSATHIHENEKKREGLHINSDTNSYTEKIAFLSTGAFITMDLQKICDTCDDFCDCFAVCTDFFSH